MAFQALRVLEALLELEAEVKINPTSNTARILVSEKLAEPQTEALVMEVVSGGAGWRSDRRGNSK